MKTSDLIRLVLANLKRMRGRVIMTAMGVLIGTAAIVVLISLAAGLQQSTTQSFGDIGALNEINIYPGFERGFGDDGGQSGNSVVLTPAKLDEFRDLPGVKAVTPILPVSASEVRLNRLSGNIGMIGVDGREVRNMSYTYSDGDGRLGRGVVLVGALVGEDLRNPQARPGDEDVAPDLYGQTLQVELQRFDEEGNQETRTVRLRVGGVIDEQGAQIDRQIVLDLQDAEDMNTWQFGQVKRNQEGYNQVLIITESPDEVAGIEAELEAQGFFSFSAQTILAQVNIIFVIIQAIFGGIGAIALLVAAIGIANTMIMSILERTREIGLMKAVGATNQAVMSIFIAEAGVIGLLGGIGGVLLGMGLSKVIDLIAQVYIAGQVASSGGTQSDPISITAVPLWLPIFAIVFSLIIGLVSGVYPAMRATQLDPVTALRNE